jgi:ribonuclease PH
LEKLGPRTCIVDCDVLQADGGTRTAAITGGYVALAIALQRLIRAQEIPSDTLLSRVAAVSAGIVDGAPLLDLCYDEDSRAQADANIVMNAEAHFIEVQGAAEGKPFSRSMLYELLDLAEQGIEQLLSIQGAVLDDL